MNTVLFVCTANQCRSPIAEALLKRRVDEAKNETELAEDVASLVRGSWIIRSAGTWAQPGRTAQHRMIDAAQEIGLDIRQHRSCKVEDVQPLSIFKLILTMEQGQKEALCMEYPDLADRIHLLPEMIDMHYDVADPIGKSMEHFRDTVQEIDGLIYHGLRRIAQLSG